MNAIRSRVRPALLAAGRGLVLSIVGPAGSISLFVLTVLSVAFIPLGLGLLTTPRVLAAVRRHANQRRLLAATWADVRIPVPYRPVPKNLRGGPAGQVERTTLMLKDPATRRDIQWLLVDMTVSSVVAVVAAGLMLYPVEGSSWRRACGGSSPTTPTGTDSCRSTARRRHWPPRRSVGCSSSSVSKRANRCCGCTS